MRSGLTKNQPQESLKETFNKIEEKYLENCQHQGPLDTSGACGVVCMISNDKIFVANLGDCRAILFSKDKGFLQLTKDHKPSDKDERLRILKNGGKIYK